MKKLFSFKVVVFVSAILQTGAKKTVKIATFGEVSLHPDLSWLQQEFAEQIITFFYKYFDNSGVHRVTPGILK